MFDCVQFNALNAAMARIDCSLSQLVAVYNSFIAADQTFSVSAPLTFNGITRIISIGAASTTANGYLTFADYNLFLAKANSATNIGTGTGWFAQKNGVDLEFKTLKAGPNVIITSNTTEVTIESVGTGEINTGSNLGPSGARVFKQKAGVNFEFRRIVQGTNLTVVENANDITITGPVPGEINTGSNLGPTGAGVFKQKAGVDFEFRKVIGVAGEIVVTENANDVTLSIDPLFSPGGFLTGNLFS